MAEKPSFLPYETRPGLGGLANEDQGRCIWCGMWWHTIYYYDGVCPSCLEEGRSTLKRLQERSGARFRRPTALLAVFIAASIAAWCAILLGIP